MKKRFSLILAVLMLLSLCACGSTHSSESTYAASDNGRSAALFEASEAAYDMADYSTGLSANTSRSASAAVQEEAADSAPEEDPEKIIYSADVTLESRNYDEAIAGVEALVQEFGGYIESSSSSSATYYNISRGNNTARITYYTLRIPGSSFSTVMERFTDLGNIPSSSIYTENVTSQYYDVEARLSAYQVQEQTLLELMEKAESVEDIIAIEERLTEVRYSIESMQSTLKNWDRRISYSTINLTVKEVLEYTPTEEQTFGEKLVKAAQDGLISAEESVLNFILWLIEALPTLIILALIVFILIKVIRAARRRRAEKRARSGETAVSPKPSIFGKKKDAASQIETPAENTSKDGDS